MSSSPTQPQEPVTTTTDMLAEITQIRELESSIKDKKAELRVEQRFVSLPRSTMYAQYMRYCGEHTLDPVNAALFGKLIRSVFPGLRTRRLGPRGNLKYHYYGIRIKPGSGLTRLTDEPTYIGAILVTLKI